MLFFHCYPLALKATARSSPTDGCLLLMEQAVALKAKNKTYACVSHIPIIYIHRTGCFLHILSIYYAYCFLSGRIRIIVLQGKYEKQNIRHGGQRPFGG